MNRLITASLFAVCACGASGEGEPDAAAVVEGRDAGATDATGPDAGDPWADEVIRFSPGEGAGFGQADFPRIVLGPPRGAGDTQGSLDVLSLGRRGAIELRFTDVAVIDGPGVDLLVFENGFTGFLELGEVEVSDDGVSWFRFPCAAALDGGTEGCAGARPVFANPALGISSTDPTVSGGDGFDLAQLGLSHARSVRITDTGTNRFYGRPGGGFDLDAVSIVNGAPIASP